jgi:DNA polymerase III alpha subunit (gram-positive type)
MFAQPGEKSQLFSYASFAGKYEVDAPFSLIDFETSGFQPGSARILEVAVIKIDAEGNILDEFTTLINPEDGNVGRTDIHQITLGMVKNAPKLSEVVGNLLSILDSSIVVAHNARFEENFLESAFREVGVKHPLMPTIDTLWLSRQVLDLPNYKLATVIDEFGYEFQDAHTALGDVRAMANVLPEMLKLGKGITFPSQLKKSPSFDTTGKVLPRKSNA